MRLDEACEPHFGRHETFHPRWGWIKKAVDAGVDPTTFTADDATLRLGVGKNMVRAIRFWGHATKTLTHVPNPENSRVPHSVPTRIGWAVFGNHGWDPYTEHPGTLWLLHWLMLAPRSELPVWWTAFSEFGALEFTDSQLQAFVEDQIDATSSWNEVHPGTIAKDVSCMLRTYASVPRTKGKRQAFDDMVDGPMRELGLLRCTDASTRTFRFVIGSKATLPPSLVLYASLDFLARTGATGQTVTVSRLATEAGAPGRIFKLTETDLTEALTLAARPHPGLITLARPAGVAQIGFNGSAAAAATEVLRTHYETLSLGPGPGIPSDLSAVGADAPFDAHVQLSLGSRTGLSLDSTPPDDPVERLKFTQDKIDAGVRG